MTHKFMRHSSVTDKSDTDSLYMPLSRLTKIILKVIHPAILNKNSKISGNTPAITRVIIFIPHTEALRFSDYRILVIHIVNNMIAFYMTGFGLGKIETNVNPTDLIFNAIALPIYIVVIIIIEKKFHLFDEVKKDDVAIFNEKKQQSQKA